MDRLIRNVQVVLGRRVRAAAPNRKYIEENLDFLSEWELEEIERSIKKVDLEKRLDLGVGSDGKISALNMQVDLLDPIESLVKEIQQKQGAEYGHLDFDAFKKLSSIVKYEYLSHINGDVYKIAGDYHLPSLLNFLDYIVGGKIQPDLHHAYEVMKQNEWPASSDWQKQYQIEYLGVKIKKYKNNRLDMKFPKREQAEKCQQTLEAWRNAKTGSY